jgi:hypothetical protein
MRAVLFEAIAANYTVLLDPEVKHVNSQVTNDKKNLQHPDPQ